MPEDLDEALQQESPAERRSLARTWALLGHAAPEAHLGDSSAVHPETAAAWVRLQAAMDHEPKVPPPPAADRPARRARSPRRWLASSLTLVLVAVIGGLFWWQRPVMVDVPPAQMLTHTLPDGSVVHLNSGAQLAYAPGFDRLPFLAASERRVELRGEAFFEVATAERPFVVETEHARIQVLGTQFNVRAWAARTTVALSEGRVAVAPLDRAEAVVNLQPGEVVQVIAPNRPPSDPSPTGLAQALAWREGGFAVTRESLPDIFDEIERRYDVPITYLASQATPLADTLSYYLSQPTLETILDDLCTASGLSYRPTSRGYEIY